ncbi:hypothetical protein VX159_04825 [Dechloromonas sp. ZY10]|uniref:hypothetical protein n=1 Tax=Dechloromonas aquae TaxID=2664436 RepID=UPI003528AD8B
MSKRLDSLFARFDALSRRERMLVAIACVGGVLMIGNSLFIDIPLARARIIGKQLQGEQSELRMLEQQVAALSSGIKDPDQENRQQRDRLRQQLDDLRRSIQAQGKNLVKPDEVPVLLESLLNRHASLRLLSMRTLAVEPAVSPPAAAGDAAKEGDARPSEALTIWKHGVEIRLQGGYQELQAYVGELEALQQRLAWGPVRLQANYPKSELQLVLYTYSLDPVWLKL